VRRDDMKHIFYGQDIVEKYTLMHSGGIGAYFVDSEQAVKAVIDEKNGSVWQMKTDVIVNTPVISQTEEINPRLTPVDTYVEIGKEKLRIIEVYPDEYGIVHCYTDKETNRCKDEESYNKMMNLQKLYDELEYKKEHDTHDGTDMFIPVEDTHESLSIRIWEGLKAWLVRITGR
jgi:hypothetical protein